MKHLSLLVLLFVPVTAQAGGWTRSLGAFYTKVGGDFYTASRYEAVGFESPEEQSYLGRQLTLYGEAGVLEAHPVQLTVTLPVVSSTIFLDERTEGYPRPRATSSRLGDLRVMAQTAVLPSKAPLAVGVEAKIPLYANGKIGSRYAGYEALFPLPGDGQVDITGWVLAGTSVPNTPLWNDAGIGVRFRTEAFIGWDADFEVRDGLVFYDTLGLTVGHFIGMVRVEGVKTFRPDLYTKEHLAIGPAVLIDIAGGLAVEGRYSYDLWSNNSTQGMGFGVGLSYRKD